MADHRRPSGRPQGARRSGEGRKRPTSAPSRSRSGGSQRPVSRRAPEARTGERRPPGRRREGGASPRQAGPSPAAIIMLVVPVLGILVVGGIVLTSPEADKADRVVVEDRNELLDRLIEQVDGLEKEGRSVIQLLRRENPEGKYKAEAFEERLQKWQDEWEELTASLRDTEGRWKEKYRGLSQYPRRVNTVRFDLGKAMPF